MELLCDMVIRLFENAPGDPSAFAKCLSPLLSDNCYQALVQIKAVLEDDSLNDRECFMKIEKIVSIYEGLGSGCGNRHDFG
ncbi:hypothetical protein H8699_01695 [Christensenellaceae bacterium NSJ-44]|uniref:Uncharacterized protein n=1 Tax=Luoshenia tenuis TaxID=2763654 RepID=A0A926HLJ3_9FIRM|nr:hypothetical protein [Luoshenia tenuis]MBC8528153.1 hypothetical protein [Luoshenia tenuis]